MNRINELYAAQTTQRIWNYGVQETSNTQTAAWEKK